MSVDTDLQDARDEAQRIVERLRRQYSAEGAPSPNERKTVYIVTGCTFPGGPEFGDYHVHDDTPQQHRAKIALNQDFRVIEQYEV